MVLSADPEHDPSTLAIVGAGAALAISDIPFQHVLGGVRVGLVNGKLCRQPHLRRDARIQAQHRRGRHRRRHRHGGSGRAAGLRSGGAGSHRVRPRLLQEDRRGHPRAGRQGRQAEVDLHGSGINKELYAQIEKQIREELTDALNTKKYPKLESYQRVARCARRRSWRRLPEEQQEEGGGAVRPLEGAHLPRRDAEGAPPSGWPRVRRDPATSRAKSACCRARTARRCSRAAKRRRWSPSRWAPRTTSSASSCSIRARPPSASCCTTTSRRSAWAKWDSCADPGAAKSATARWPNGPFRPSFPTRRSSPTPCAW